MIDAFIPLLSRIIGIAVAALGTWLASKGIDIDTDTRTQLVTAIVAVLLPIFTAIYAIVHRLVDRYVNPGDAASSHLAAAEKAQVTEMKKNDLRNR